MISEAGAPREGTGATIEELLESASRVERGLPLPPALVEAIQHGTSIGGARPVADIHGEVGALDALLERLGYTPDGRHRKGRRLAFLGDLVDRGADSPAVVERVAEMVVGSRAQCVLGNHELNLLTDARREGNGWFWPEAILNEPTPRIGDPMTFSPLRTRP